MSALCRLEAAGIEVVTSLSSLDIIPSLYSSVGLDSEQDSDHSLLRIEDKIDHFVRKWAESGLLPLTWRSLVQVLEKLELQTLREKMEGYLASYSKYIHN